MPYARVQDCVGGRSIASHQSFLCVSTLAAGWIDTVVHTISATIGVVVFDARRWRKRFARGGSRRPRRPIEACGVCRNASPPATLSLSLHLRSVLSSSNTDSHHIARKRRMEAASELSTYSLSVPHPVHRTLLLAGDARTRPASYRLRTSFQCLRRYQLNPVPFCFTALGWR